RLWDASHRRCCTLGERSGGRTQAALAGIRRRRRLQPELRIEGLGRYLLGIELLVDARRELVVGHLGIARVLGAEVVEDAPSSPNMPSGSWSVAALRFSGSVSSAASLPSAPYIFRPSSSALV